MGMIELHRDANFQQVLDSAGAGRWLTPGWWCGPGRMIGPMIRGCSAENQGTFRIGRRTSTRTTAWR